MNLSVNRKPKKRQKYGCWTLKKPIGEGGNGFVFLAHDENGNEAAIKILAKLEGKSKKVYERFKREVKIIQENSDIRGIMKILDSFLPDDSSKDFPWYVMPVAQPLETFITDKSVEAKVLAILEIGHTLACLHQRGISHRDIKPANILVKDNTFYLVDFGLASIEDGIDLTSTGDQIGAKWTMAPEMKRESHKADGRPADVYSLAKTLWILITGKKYGFDGQYDAVSINGLKRFNLYLPEDDGLHYLRPQPLYIKPLDQLIKECTDDNPLIRPSIEKFTNSLTDWLGLFKNFKKRNPLEWRDVQVKLFPFSVPQRAIWEKLEDIVDMLNYLFSIHNLNHVLLPGGGGLDFEGAKIEREQDTLELTLSERNVFIVKPKRLIFESFGYDWEWNYFRLETGELEPIEKIGRILRYFDQELVEIRPLEYIDRRYWDEGAYQDEELPTDSRLVSRYIKGEFVIIQKTSTYNRAPSTYDGRHNQMSTDEFRNYIAEKVMFIQDLRQDRQIINIAHKKELGIDEIVLQIMNNLFHEEYLKKFRRSNQRENVDGEEFYF